MSFDIVLTFFVICFLLVVSPGPNGVLILKTVSLNGKKNATYNLLGMFIATYVHGVLSFFGLSAIILSSAEIFFAIKIIGALYLLFLGLKSIYSIFKKNETLEQNNINDFKIQKNKSNKVSFIEGFLSQMLNPKVSMFYLAAFPQLIDFANAAFLDIFILTTVHASTNFLWFTLVIFIIGKSTNSLNSQKMKDMINGITGLVFIYFSYKILNVEISK